MKKFNLFNEIIVVNKNIFLQALSSNKLFAINTQGEIFYEVFPDAMAFIFKGKYKNTNNSLSLNQSIDLSNSLGKNYQVVEDENRILIKAFSNWQELININTPQASYDDTTADGVAEFATKELEDIGWHADEFNIKYRTLIEILEKECDGILLCIEQEEPYQFSGLGFIQNNIQAENILYNYCQSIISKKIENDADFAKDNLTDDERTAAKFFKISLT